MYKESSDCFSETLKRLIEKNNIKKIELANYLGVSKSAISNYLSGISMPKIDTIQKIASFFGVGLEQLLPSESENKPIVFNEGANYFCSIPLFHNMMISENVIYRLDNFIGEITAPVFLPRDSKCYAVRTDDDSMKNFGISKYNIVIFDSNLPPENGDLAAVFYKTAKRINIRKFVSENKKIRLYSSDNCEEFIASSNCDIVILGKVLSATFNPNAK